LPQAHTRSRGSHTSRASSTRGSCSFTRARISTRRSYNLAACSFVGAGNSGAEIALETAREHRTWLSGRDTGHFPMDINGRAFQVFGRLMSFLGNRVLTIETPLGRKVRPRVRAGGGPLVRVKPAALGAAGVERAVARTISVRDGRPVLEDGQVLAVTNVIWCTGFKHTADWLDVPIATVDGWPQEVRGVVPTAPGLYFIGLPFLYSANSSMIVGVGPDAAYLVDTIAARSGMGRVADRAQLPQ
jgi:putative flavoprotein involved in K+ transport